jgi:cysteine synthase B
MRHIEHEALDQSFEALARAIGNTPLWSLGRLAPAGTRVLAKMEWCQLGGSVKARVARTILSTALNRGDLHPGMRVLESSSGNTGIALASICAKLDLPLTIFMPAKASEERKLMLRALDAELVLTPAEEGSDGAMERARAHHAAHPGTYYYVNQYDSPLNIRAHYETTGPEIWRQTGGSLTHFVTGLGSSGTFIGTARRLREFSPAVRCIALQPASEADDFAGWKHLPSVRQPGIYDAAVPDDIRHVNRAEAEAVMRRLARAEGLLVSPSAAANVAGALQVAESAPGSVVVTVLPDSAAKYGAELQQVFA